MVLTDTRNSYYFYKGQVQTVEKVSTISWLTVSNQIVKSLSLSYKKFYFFNIVQPIDPRPNFLQDGRNY